MRTASFCLIALLLPALAMPAAAATNSTIDTSKKWAWSAGASWINCRPSATNGAVVGRSYCWGYFYSSTAGWMHLGDGSPTNGYQYTNNDEDDYGVNVDGQGHLTGYAWCESSGWINFEWTNKTHSSAPKIDLKTGNMSGNVWGDSLGWISLTNSWTYVKTTNLVSHADGNTNNIPDTWEMANIGDTTTLAGGGGTNDYDKDGVSDYNEYLAGTSPTNKNDYLHMSAVVVTNSTNVVITWPCSDTRLYDIEKRTNLMNGSWVQYMRVAVTSTPTTITIPTEGATQVFYRVQAVLPLAN